jgi:hypothetical protein
MEYDGHRRAGENDFRLGREQGNRRTQSRAERAAILRIRWLRYVGKLSGGKELAGRAAVTELGQTGEQRLELEIGSCHHRVVARDGASVQKHAEQSQNADPLA